MHYFGLPSLTLFVHLVSALLAEDVYLFIHTSVHGIFSHASVQMCPCNQCSFKGHECRDYRDVSGGASRAPIRTAVHGQWGLTRYGFLSPAFTCLFTMKMLWPCRCCKIFSKFKGNAVLWYSLKTRRPVMLVCMLHGRPYQCGCPSRLLVSSVTCEYHMLSPWLDILEASYIVHW